MAEAWKSAPPVENAVPAWSKAPPAESETTAPAWASAPPVDTTPQETKEPAPAKEFSEEAFQAKYGESSGNFADIKPSGWDGASVTRKLLDPVLAAETVKQSLGNMRKAMEVSRLNGFLDNAMKTILTPRPSRGILKEMGFNSLEEYNEHEQRIYKDNILRGVSGFEKVAGASIGTVVSMTVDAPGFRALGLAGQGAKAALPALTQTLSNSKLARILKLSVVGGSSMGAYEALRQAADEGSINSPEEVLLWGGAGALGGPALDKLARVGGFIASKVNAEATLRIIEKYTQKAMKNGKSPHAAYDEALAHSGFTSEEIASVVDHTGRSTHWADAVKPATEKDFMKSFFGKAWNGLTSPLVSSASATKQVIDKVIRPVSGELHKRAPALFNYLNKNILEANRYHQSLLDRYVPIEYVAKALPKKQRAVFWDALSNSKVGIVDDIVNQMPKAVKGAGGKMYNPREVVTSVRNLWDELLEVERGAGIDVARIADYWPHALKYGEYEKLSQTLGREAQNEFQQMVKHEMERLGGKELSAGQMEDLILSYIRGSTPKGFHRSALTKPRKIDFITPDIAKHYEDPLQAGLRRIDRHAHAMQKRRLFGKHLKDSSIDATGEESVAAFMHDLLCREEIYAKDMPKITEILKAFAGYQPTGRNLQDAKNIFYMTTIGQVESALTQLGDITVGAYINGYYNSLLGFYRAGTSRGIQPFREFGLKGAAQELASTSRTAKWLDTNIKITQFSNIDTMGKTHLVNSAWVKNERLVKSQGGIRDFRKKWAPYFGDETENLIGDLQNKTLSDNVRLLLWNELTSAQPVSLLEVPQKYLEMQNARVLYALSTFALKQMDLLRNTAVNEIKHGNVGKGLFDLTRYALYVGAGNTTTQNVKDWVRGRDVKWTEFDRANLFKQLLVSEYLVGELSAGNKETEAIAKQVLSAPIGIGDIGASVASDLGKLAEGTLTMKTSRSAEKVPYVGSILSNWFGAGLIRYRKRQEREFLESVGFDDDELDQYEEDYNDY